MRFYLKQDTKDLLVAPKDKDPITKSGVIYRVNCERVKCDEEKYRRILMNIWGEVQGTSEGPSPIYDHFNTTGNTTILENLSIVGSKDWNLMRLVTEAIYTRVSSPSPNKNIGKYHLPQIWDEVLFNISECKICG